MKFSKLTLAIATTLGASASFSAFAIDLYVDTKTKQIYAEPGPHRQLIGAFERVEDEPAAAPADTAEIAAVREDLEMKTNEIKALQEHMDEVEKVKVTMDKKGLQVESADKNFKFKLGGRIQTDATWNSNGNGFTRPNQISGRPPVFGTPVDANDGTEVRRGRMRFEGVFYHDWLTRLEADFADDKVAVKDAFLQYNGLDLFNITVGQQKQNFSRELQESSNDLMFTERSLMNILAAPVVDRAIGINFQSVGKNWVAKAGAFGDSISASANQLDEGWGINSRLIYNPILEKTTLIHLGVAGNYRQPDGNQNVAKGKALQLVYETTNMSNLDLIQSNVVNINNIGMLGLEAAGMWGPFSVGGEYTEMWIDRKNGLGDLALNGWYGEAAWTLTGESRKYKEGNFGYLEPAKPFSLKNGTWGAVETAVRYSGADLNDNNFDGGYIQNLTLAVNWYLNSNVRLMADWTTIVALDNSPVSTTQTPGGTDLLTDSFWLRAQVAY
ncbi:MAG: porin [Methylococcales bacterium]|nr:porin [Methylococcales bacterium]